MSDFKLRQKVTIDGQYFVDKKPRKAIVVAVEKGLYNDGLFTLGIQHLADTGVESLIYTYAYEVPAFGDRTRIVKESSFRFKEVVAGWKKDAK